MPRTTPAESTVAIAAPRTPIPKAKIKIGSSTKFATAPLNTLSMPTRPKPCELMKLFIPRLTITKRVPAR